jgi:hypothetical protein
MRVVLRLEKQLGEDRMSGVGCGIVEDNLSEAGQLDGALALGCIGEGETAQLNGLIGRNADLQKGLNPEVDPFDLEKARPPP